jgi:hypothetical protein
MNKLLFQVVDFPDSGRPDNHLRHLITLNSHGDLDLTTLCGGWGGKWGVAQTFGEPVVFNPNWQKSSAREPYYCWICAQKAFGLSEKS